MAGLYLSIKNDLLGLFAAAWSHPDIPVYWRDDDADPLPDPSTVTQFLRNEIDYGRERTLAYGGGQGANLKAQYGSVVLRVFTARAALSEDSALELMADAMAIFRSQRISGSYGTGSELSFIGEGSGFDAGPVEDGNYFLRGSLMVFEYRFRG